MSNDVEYVYRQDSNFYFLSRFEEPNSVAVLRPSASDGKRFILFVRPRDARREKYEGGRPNPEESLTRYGADAAFRVNDFNTQMVRYDPVARTFSGYLADAEKIYLRRGRRQLLARFPRPRRADAREGVWPGDDRGRAPDRPQAAGRQG